RSGPAFDPARFPEHLASILAIPDLLEPQHRLASPPNPTLIPLAAVGGLELEVIVDFLVYPVPGPGRLLAAPGQNHLHHRNLVLVSDLLQVALLPSVGQTAVSRLILVSVSWSADSFAPVPPGAAGLAGTLGMEGPRHVGKEAEEL